LSSPEPLADSSAEAVAAALTRLARAQPEAPFLFYRNCRGHFRWWSFATVSAFLEQGGLGDEKPSVKGVVVEREAVELLGGFLRAARRHSEGSAAVLPDSTPGAARDVWISWRSLDHPAELALAQWAIVAGAAILVEPGACLHPELFAWARPTIVSGSVEELLELAAKLSSLAPRFLRRRWLRQRSERLRLMLVEGGAGAEELSRVARRWQALSPRLRPIVAAFPHCTLV
jgi:hypothetical protein